MVLVSYCSAILLKPEEVRQPRSICIGWKEEDSWNFTITEMIAYGGRAYCREHTIPVLRTVASFVNLPPLLICASQRYSSSFYQSLQNLIESLILFSIFQRFWCYVMLTANAWYSSMKAANSWQHAVQFLRFYQQLRKTRLESRRYQASLEYLSGLFTRATIDKTLFFLLQ